MKFSNALKIVVHNNIIVHFDTGAEGDYLPHVTFFARAKRVPIAGGAALATNQ